MKLKDASIGPEDVKDMVNQYMIETYTRFDFVCERTDGMYFYDENNEAYLDFYGGIAVNNAGNTNKNVVKAIQEQAADVIHTFNYPYTIPQALLAKKICETIKMDKIFYQSSGTEANEAMIKLARKYGMDNYGSEKYHIITAQKSFHGRTYASMTATGQPESAVQTGFKPLLPGFSYGEFNNIESFRELITENTIAIMLEPVQGEGGVIPATREFMQGIAKLCNEKGLLLLIDEIQTGWCRTGRVMAYMDYNIKPDIISMAKGMGGGMPIGAICASAEVASAFGFGAHGTTYGGNPVCCAASLAQINELLDLDLAENAREVGNYFMEQLKTLPGIKEVRGKGLLVAAEFDKPIAGRVKEACLKNRLMITSIGNSIIRMVPPLIVTKEHCDQAVKILNQVLLNEIV